MHARPGLGGVHQVQDWFRRARQANGALRLPACPLHIWGSDRHGVSAHFWLHGRELMILIYTQARGVAQGHRGREGRPTDEVRPDCVRGRPPHRSGQPARCRVGDTGHLDGRLRQGSGDDCL